MTIHDRYLSKIINLLKCAIIRKKNQLPVEDKTNLTAPDMGIQTLIKKISNVNALPG